MCLVFEVVEAAGLHTRGAGGMMRDRASGPGDQRTRKGQSINRVFGCSRGAARAPGVMSKVVVGGVAGVGGIPGYLMAGSEGV